MNIRQGLFRLWVIFSALFVIGIGWKSFDELAGEFAEEAKQWAPWDNMNPPRSLAVDCGFARGMKGTDYTTEAGSFCVYELSTFRAQYPEYGHFSDAELARRLYVKMGLSGSFNPGTREIFLLDKNNHLLPPEKAVGTTIPPLFPGLEAPKDLLDPLDITELDAGGPWRRLFKTATAAVGVPLAVLILGVAFAWAGAGFSRSDKRG